MQKQLKPYIYRYIEACPMWASGRLFYQQLLFPGEPDSNIMHIQIL